MRQFRVNKATEAPFIVEANWFAREIHPGREYTSCTASFYRREEVRADDNPAVVTDDLVAFVKEPGYIMEVPREGEPLDAARAPEGTVVRVSDACRACPGWIFEKDTGASWYTPAIERCYSDAEVQRMADKYGATVLWLVNA